MGLRVATLTDLSEVEELSHAWEHLAVASGAPALSRPSYCIPWWRSIGRGELHVVAVFDERNELVGVAPLHRRQFAGQSILRWLGHSHGVVGTLVVSPRSGVAEAIWEAIDGSGMLQLRHVRDDGPGLIELRRSESWDVDARLDDTAPFVDLRGVGSVDDLLKGDRKLRQQLRRADRQAHAADVVIDFEIHEDIDHRSAERLVSRMRPVAQASASSRGLPDPFEPECSTRFVRDVLAESDAIVVIAALGGRAAGFSVLLRAERTVSGWLTRFDPVVAKYSPGHLMHRHTLDWALHARVDRLDMQLGDDPYKRRWATGWVDAIAVTAAPTGRLVRARAMVAGVEAAHRWRARLGVRQPGHESADRRK